MLAISLRGKLEQVKYRRDETSQIAMGHPLRDPGMRLNVGRRIVLAAMLSGTSFPVEAQEPFFPGSVFLPKNKEVNSIIDDMTSVHLKAMKEPSLWKLSEKDRRAKVYRFLWLHPGKPQIGIRLSRTAGDFVLHVAEHDGPPGVTAGRQILSKDVELTDQQGERLVGLIERTKFWAAPVEVKESQGIADGDGIVIEGVKDGRYHVINRAGSTTGEGYKAFCRSLLELAGEPDVLKEWDRRRQEERGSPEYRPEPPQTEDQGDYKSDPEDIR